MDTPEPSDKAKRASACLLEEALQIQLSMHRRLAEQLEARPLTRSTQL